MNNKIKVTGNDACDSGVITVTYNKDALTTPLILDFKREDGFECTIGLHHYSTKQLLKLIIESI